MDVMNLDESILDEIDRRVRLFIPAARRLPTEKTDSAAVLAQERLNAVWELIFALPVLKWTRRAVSIPFNGSWQTKRNGLRYRTRLQKVIPLIKE